MNRMKEQSLHRDEAMKALLEAMLKAFGRKDSGCAPYRVDINTTKKEDFMGSVIKKRLQSIDVKDDESDQYNKEFHGVRQCNNCYNTGNNFETTLEDEKSSSAKSGSRYKPFILDKSSSSTNISDVDENVKLGNMSLSTKA